jgi:amino acid transporter
MVLSDRRDPHRRLGVRDAPIALLPMLNTMLDTTSHEPRSADQAAVAIVTLVFITVLNIYGVKIVAIVNNTGVFFEVLGMVSSRSS